MVVGNSLMTRKKPYLVRPARGDIGSLENAGSEAIHRWYCGLFGADVPGGNTELARRRIAWRIQAESGGGLPDSAKQHALGIARTFVGRKSKQEQAALGPAVSSKLPSDHDSRVPVPGAVLVREYQGKQQFVRVLPSGFEWEGRVYRSLSAVAKAITGTKWNGYEFFGLEHSRGK